jgi:hypothetical protein
VSPYRRLRRASHHLYARPPAAVETLQLRLRGKVLWTDLESEPNRIRISVTRVHLPNGWVVRPARGVTLALAPEAVMRRATGSGHVPATLDQFTPGRAVTVWTNDVAQTRTAAKAAAGAHTIRDILLRRS